MTFWRFGLPFAIGAWLAGLLQLYMTYTISLGWPFFCTGIALGCIVYDHFFVEKSDDVDG